VRRSCASRCSSTCCGQEAGLVRTAGSGDVHQPPPPAMSRTCGGLLGFAISQPHQHPAWPYARTLPAMLGDRTRCYLAAVVLYPGMFDGGAPDRRAGRAGGRGRRRRGGGGGRGGARGRCGPDDAAASGASKKESLAISRLIRRISLESAHQDATAREQTSQEAFASGNRDYRDSGLAPARTPQHPCSRAGREFLISCWLLPPSPARERPA